MKAWATPLIRATLAGRGAAMAPRTVPAIARYSTAPANPEKAHASLGAAQMQHPVEDTAAALRLLRSQPNHYVVASITGRTFVLSESDVVTLPRIRGVQVGDVLDLDRIHEVGSRNYTLRAQDPALGRRKAQGGKFPLVLFQEKGAEDAPRAAAVGVATRSTAMAQSSSDSVLPWSSSWAAQLVPSGLAHVGAVLSPEVVRVRCVVVEHTKGPMERIEKFKRRKGYDKVVTHKQPYTRLRVDAITLGSP
ncbi:hypothetical protein GLX27_003920 [Malassezia furfur]|uniref:Large ribosomal subunit protein bL21m n=1 Tax=Malassezia furfur TaxID=55194 RepID=A0ABY8EUK4_MALFU|nr:hypothetical protein CBS14141_003965 [Malassezia furfur]WFD49240.1 hypothetical protein GLX27_003920 [Malassezia furfur]